MPHQQDFALWLPLPNVLDDPADLVPLEAPPISVLTK